MSTLEKYRNGFLKAEQDCRELESQLQTKDDEIERLRKKLDRFKDVSSNAWDNLEQRCKTKDALIKELVDVVEYYRHTHPDDLMISDRDIVSKNPHMEMLGKKARTLLNSEAVKVWRGEK